MKGLDLSKLKKVSSDKGSTTFKHADGHEIKIAHKGLSPKLKGDLFKLPHFDGGGYVKVNQDDPYNVADVAMKSAGLQGAEDLPISSAAQEAEKRTSAQTKMGVGYGEQFGPDIYNKNLEQVKSEEERNQNTGFGAFQPKPTEVPNSPMAPTSPEPTGNPADIAMQSAGITGQPAQAPAPAPMPEAQAPTGVAAAVPVAREPAGAGASAAQTKTPQEEAPKPSTPAEMSHYLSEQNAAWEHDLVNGHVQPKTYESLFADKNTLGKIGSLFGMLVSGLGSGMSGQPNMMMDMMNKEIDRDLSAQKTSKENAVNYLRLNQQGQMNTAQIEQLKHQGKLTDAQAKMMGVESDLKSLALTKSKMMQSGFHKILTNIDAMPDGPQKEAAKGSAGLLYQKMGEHIMDMNDQMAGATNFYNTLYGTQSGGNTEQSFQQKTTALPMLGPQGEKRAEIMKSQHLSGVPEVEGQQASRAIPEEKRDKIVAMQTLSDKGKDVLNFARQHQGSVDPATLKVGAQKAAEMVSFYSKVIDKGVMTEHRQKWLDDQIASNPTTVFQNILGNNKQLEEIINSNDGRKRLELKGLGFTPKEPTSSETRYDKQGNAWVMGPNGKPVRAK